MATSPGPANETPEAEKIYISSIVISVLITISLIIAAFCLRGGSFNFMLKASKEALTPLAEADSIQYNVINANLAAGTPNEVILQRQFDISQKVKLYYQGLAVSYYVNYYAFAICSIFSATLLTIAVFMIANLGWKNANLPLKALLLTTICISSVYYFLPNVLNNKENIQKNTEKVIVFQKIQYEMLSFSTSINKPGVNSDSALRSYYYQISSNFDFNTTIDASKIGSNPQDLLKGLQP